VGEIGQQDAITPAFAAAGWSASDALNAQSSFGVMRAQAIEDQGYKEGPVSMLLDGKQPVATFFKSRTSCKSAATILYRAETSSMVAAVGLWGVCIID
jgi:hypothetical protein